jgi:hypothetical protein
VVVLQLGSWAEGLQRLTVKKQHVKKCYTKSIDKKIISTWISEIRLEDVDWIHLAQNRDRW